MTSPETPERPSSPLSAVSSNAVGDPVLEAAAIAEAPAASFPVATIRTARTTTSALFLTSRMWWMTLACFVLAFWLTWRSLPSNGPTITIRFPDGHGLKSADGVRHRGIDVGSVADVTLSDDLAQISATVILTPGAAGLAREGTRFWIVRPQLSLSGISGLETAVGSKYIAVSPGDPNGARRREFDGLAAAPPDENSGNGIDIVLRSDARHGVTVGAPVTWRGIDAGQVLSISLAPDARFVDFHVRISSEYTRLLRSTSQFWVTSGLGVDIGLSGVTLNADSLSTIIRGGVSFATPTVGENQSPVAAGHLFVLHDEADPDWLTAASSLPLVDFRLPPTLTIQGTRRTTLLGIPRNQNFTANGILVSGANMAHAILTAADVCPDETGNQSADDSKDRPEFLISQPTDDAVVKVHLHSTDGPPTETSGQTVDSDQPTAVPEPDSNNAGDQSPTDGITWLNADGTFGSMQAVGMLSLRHPDQPEDCCICRSVRSSGEPSSVIQCITRDELAASGHLWSVTAEIGDLSSWHGAPVVSMSDGKIIGVFLATKSGPMIAPLTSHE